MLTRYRLSVADPTLTVPSAVTLLTEARIPVVLPTPPPEGAVDRTGWGLGLLLTGTDCAVDVEVEVETEVLTDGETDGEDAGAEPPEW